VQAKSNYEVETQAKDLVKMKVEVNTKVASHAYLLEPSFVGAPPKSESSQVLSLILIIVTILTFQFDTLNMVQAMFTI